MRRTGEVGRSSATLADVLAGATSLASWKARLSAENRIFLEDASPAVRVRAFDWLNVRGAAPEGFDPLASLAARRAALAAAEGEEEQ